MPAQFTKHTSVFKTQGAAHVFQRCFATDRVVVRIGRRFGVIAPAIAKRLKLKVVKGA